MAGGVKKLLLVTEKWGVTAMHIDVACGGKYLLQQL